MHIAVKTHIEAAVGGLNRLLTWMVEAPGRNRGLPDRLCTEEVLGPTRLNTADGETIRWSDLFEALIKMLVGQNGSSDAAAETSATVTALPTLSEIEEVLRIVVSACALVQEGGDDLPPRDPVGLTLVLLASTLQIAQMKMEM